MIGYLSGKVRFLYDDACILDVSGVGYRVFVDTSTMKNLRIGDETEFFIHTAVREDSITLFGMSNQSSFELFELLLTVSGIGAKGALAIVSKISAADFAKAVMRQEIKTLMRLPGVGKKSAERILLELKDKINSQWAVNSSEGSSQNFDTLSDAEEALSAFGYTSAEISAVLKEAPPNSTTEQLIKFALKELSRLN